MASLLSEAATVGSPVGVSAGGSFARSSSARATPRDALELATGKWLRGERLKLGRLAEELGVARGTLFNWVGTRESFYEEIICYAHARHFNRLVRSADARGLDRLEAVLRADLAALLSSKALRAFLASSPGFALRILTAPDGAVHQRAVQLKADFLRRVIEEAGIEPLHDVLTLAHLVVRISEAFVYAPVLNGSTPDIEMAVQAIRILVSAKASDGAEDVPRATGLS